MGLSIKNEQTHRLVRELATLRGVSLVAAVTEAVQEKLDREKAQRNTEKKGLAAWLLEIGRETAPLMDDGRTSKEMFDDLYDEKGLPK